jgi:hypothetical protein
MTWRDVIKVHPAADAFPMMSEDELRALGEDTQANGLRIPIVLWGSAPPTRIDGRNRRDALDVSERSVAKAVLRDGKRAVVVAVERSARNSNRS